MIIRQIEHTISHKADGKYGHRRKLKKARDVNALRTLRDLTSPLIVY